MLLIFTYMGFPAIEPRTALTRDAVAGSASGKGVP